MAAVHGSARDAARRARKESIAAIRAGLAEAYRVVPSGTTVAGPAPTPHILSPLYEYAEPHCAYPRDPNYFGHGGNVHALRGVHRCNFHQWHLISRCRHDLSARNYVIGRAPPPGRRLCRLCFRGSSGAPRPPPADRSAVPARPRRR